MGQRLRVISGGKKIGVDAGTSLVKVVEVGKVGDQMALNKWSVLPIRVPADASPEAARSLQARVIDAAISKSDCKCRDVVVGVPGNSAFIRNIKLPPIPSSKIDQIVRYEIQQTIPFPIENIALDYQMLEEDESSEIEVIMVAMKGEVAEAFIHGVEQAKVNVGIVDSIPLALYNCYHYNGYTSKEDCTAIIELGATTSNVLIELGGELRYCRSVSIGGKDITGAIARELNLPFEQAERIKIQHGLIFPEAQESNFTKDQVRVSRAIAGVLDKLVGEIKLTVGYFRSLSGSTAISRGVLAGGGSLLKNIRPFLADRLGVQVEILNPFKKVGVPKNLVAARKIAPVLATAVGLALRTTQECCQLNVSLTPPSLKAAQSRRAKRAFNMASFLVAAGIVGLILWRAIPEWTNRAEIMDALNAEIGRYEPYEDQLRELRSQKSVLEAEYKIYYKYPELAVDPMTTLVMLTDSVRGDAWIKSITIDEDKVTVEGSINSETKVESLKQLSSLRLELEKYCTEVKVNSQEETSDGLTYSLDLSGIPNFSRYTALRATSQEETKTQEAKTENEQVQPRSGA
jgi:type IV pilus assembly protein PilM